MAARLSKIGSGLLAFLVMLPLMVVGGVVLFVSTLSGDPETLAKLCQKQQLSGSVSGAIPKALSSPEQLQNANVIITTGEGRSGLTERDRKLALMVSAQESKWMNVPPGQGDLDSIGLFQQRPSQGWGTPEQLIDPVYAANKFYDALVAIEDRKRYSLLTLALMVQRPSRAAYLSPGNYFPGWETVADSVLGSVNISVPDMSNGLCDYLDGINTPEASALEELVRAALARTGNPYAPSASDSGAGLVSASAKDAGFTLPSTLTGLTALTENQVGGVSAEFIAPKDLQVPIRGDLPLISTDNDPDAEEVGIAAGAISSVVVPGDASKVRLSTYNIQVGEGFPARVQRAGQIIRQNGFDVIGFQEVESEAIYNALASQNFLGDRYAIYPSNPSTVFRNSLAARPIVYDKTRFEVVQTDELRFLRMQFDDKFQPAVMPVLRLRDLQGGQEFYVTNVHYAAFPRYAKERWEAGNATVQKVVELNSQAIPVVALGDFNSNFVVRDGPNPTYQRKRENLAYCQLTANGLMNNARDLSDGFNAGSYCPRVSGASSVDHIYTSREISISKGGFGEVGGTLTDHNTAPYADVLVPATSAASSQSGQPRGDSYVGVSEDGSVVELRSLQSIELVGVLRLTVPDATLIGKGDWVLPMSAGSFSYTGNTYGPRIHPIYGTLDFHNGMDISAACGTPLYAMNDGQVSSIGSSSNESAWGNYIEINFGGRYSSVYAHMTTLADGVSVGSQVKSGQLVGTVGTTGASTGCHLHLTTAICSSWRLGDKLCTVDPLYFMEQIGFSEQDLG